MRISILLGTLAAFAIPSVTFAFDSPQELVDAIYQPYRNGQQHNDIGQFYSERLKRLYIDHANAKAAELDITGSVPLDIDPVIDFNPFIDAENALILDVAVGQPVVLGEKALVTVAFHNFDHPTMLSLALIREADGWKVDDVTSTGGDQNWMLSWLLQFDPWGM